MKKLFVLLPFVLLSACTTTHSSSVTRVQVDSSHEDMYRCNDDSWVHARYSDEGQIAHLKITMPRASLRDRQVTLKRTAATSGVRYVNDSDLGEKYVWHTHRNEATMSVTPNRGRTFSVNCTK